MAIELKLIRIDGGTGVILPEEVLAKLGVGVGDTLFVKETPTGVELTPKDPDAGSVPNGSRNLLNIRWQEASGESRNLLDIRIPDGTRPSE